MGRSFSKYLKGDLIMEHFNKMMDILGNADTVEGPPDPAMDSDTTTGSFGSIDTAGMAPEAPSEDKLVLYLDSGVEIHIPTSIHTQMIAAMNDGQSEIPEVQITMGGELGGNPKAGKGCGKGLGLGKGDGPMNPSGEGNEDCEDNNLKDCPFDKDDEKDKEGK